MARPRVYRSPDEIRGRQRQARRRYEARHPEKVRERARRWAANNRQKVRDRVTAYNAAHPDRHREWAKLARDHLTHQEARRRATAFGASGGHTLQQWIYLCEAHDWACAYCGRIGPLTRDHVVALRHGGGDDISNVLPACRSCNTSKKDKSLNDYVAWLERSA